MNGKSSTQVTRIGCAFKAMEVACVTLSGQIDVAQKEITREFADNVINLVTKLSPLSFVIDLNIALKAIKCIDYFNLNKLILSGYDVDPIGTFDDAFNKIVALRSNRSTLSSHFASLSSNILRLMKRAFMVPHTRINASKLGANNCTVTVANEVFQKLEECNLGVQELVTSSNYHQTNYFIRISSTELLNNPILGQSIVDLGLNLQSVIRCLQETEYLEYTNKQEQRVPASKRNRSDNENSPPITAKKSKATSITKVHQRKDNGVPYLVTEPIDYDDNAREPFTRLNSNTQQTTNSIGQISKTNLTLTINGLSIEKEIEENVTSVAKPSSAEQIERNQSIHQQNEVNIDKNNLNENSNSQIVNPDNNTNPTTSKQINRNHSMHDLNDENGNQSTGNTNNQIVNSSINIGAGGLNVDTQTINNISLISTNCQDKIIDSNLAENSFGLGSSINTTASNSSNSSKATNSSLISNNSKDSGSSLSTQNGVTSFVRKIDPVTGLTKRGRLTKEETAEKMRIESLNKRNDTPKTSVYDFDSDSESVSTRTRARSRSNSQTQEESHGTQINSRPRTSTQLVKPITVVARKKKTVLTKTYTPRNNQ
jgi:hypothetical protein